VCHIEPEDPQFFALLSQIDEEVALRAQAQGCPCGGVSHQAHYPRKPRGCVFHRQRDRCFTVNVTAIFILNVTDLYL